MLTEADSHLGFANRLLAPLARRVFLAFPIAGRDGARYEVAGRPVPAGTGKADRERGAGALRDPARSSRACWSSAARSARAGSTTPPSTRSARPRPARCCTRRGRRDHDDLRRRLDELGSPAHYRLHAYIEPFADALAAADLVVARAGGSVLELAAAGLPAILVPYPHATADHQTSNARYMERAGAAVVVPDAELDGPRLAREVAALLGAPAAPGGDGPGRPRGRATRRRGADRREATLGLVKGAAGSA